MIKQCECYSLDWVIAHDAIIFSCNMLMHYHAFHLLLSFFPMPYLLLVSSFSFLLSLVNFLSMAPKKSIPSKNFISFRGSSSSSSPSVPNSVRFHDEKAKEDFYENFSNRAIHLEH